jgi:hypothetical protein
MGVTDQAKAFCLGTDGGDARGCRLPLEDVVVVLIYVSRFRVKTHVLMDSVAATVCAVTLMRALLWSSGALGFQSSDFLESMLGYIVVLFFRF